MPRDLILRFPHSLGSRDLPAVEQTVGFRNFIERRYLGDLISMNSAGPKLDAMTSDSLGSVFPVERKANQSCCVLAVDSEPYTRDSLERHLCAAGYRVLRMADAAHTVTEMQDDVQVVFWGSSQATSTHDELASLRRIGEQFPNAQVIVIGDEESDQEMLTELDGLAWEYLGQSFNSKQLLSMVAKAARYSALSRDYRELREAVGGSSSISEFAPCTATSKQLLDRISAIGNLELNLLVTGERGTGKSTVARMIHQQSSRAKAPFIYVNCASMPHELLEVELFGCSRDAFLDTVNDRPGKLEIADGGTLFLDEINELPLALQRKLLGFFESGLVQRVGCNQRRHVDVRIIAATHQDLRQHCQTNRFDEDLYCRLNAISLHLPPLRERQDEIPSLVRHVLEQVTRSRRGQFIELSADAFVLLESYAWPGNIRELESTLEHALARCRDNVIQREDIQFPETSSSPGGQVPNGRSLARRTLADIEKQAILDTLEALNGNKAKTARELGISEKSIYNKMRRHGLM